MNRIVLCAVVWSGLGVVGVAVAGDRVLPAANRSIALADKHDHKSDGKEEEHKGEKKDLGKQKVGAFEVQVTQVGDVTPGEEAIFIIKPKGEGEPKAVRAWVGVESGQGSIKTKAEEEKEGEWHAHHPVSKPLPAKSKVWVELETGAGKAKASFERK
jgi:hypothetical protein